MMMDRLAFETIEPKQTADAAVIWLHGLGADGFDFMPITPRLELEDVAIRFIFPHAPSRPVTLNQGMVMPAWFDIDKIAPRAKHDEEGLEWAYQQIDALIEMQHQAGIAYNRIVLVGFSQGGALALYTALRGSHRLAGVMGLSTFLPLTESLQALVTTSASKVPVFLAHGLQDSIVPMIAGEMTKDFLHAHGYAVSWHTYTMEHQVCAQEIKDVGIWLRAVLG